MGPIPTSSTLSLSRAELEQGFTPTSSSGGQIQIFNIEAYCKLCNKEFCNKYFLKTHMANKHGIYSDSVNNTSSNSNSGPRFEGGALNHPSSQSSLFDKSPMRFPGSNTPVTFSGSFMTMSSPKSSEIKSGLLIGHPLMTSREAPKDSEISRPQSHSEMRSPLPSPIRPHSTGAGNNDRTTPSSQSPKSGPPPLIPGSTRIEENGSDKEMTVDDLKRMDKELLRQGLDMSSLPSGIRLPMVPSMSPFGGPMHFDNLLKMNPLSPMDSLRKDPELENEFDKNKRPIPNVPSLPKGPEGSGQKGSMTPDRLRQMGVINADAFCEFCCKEFCNKYFLRVHKLKKHGVCSPELPPEKVQKILQQMAKEAGKTGQPMPPLTMGAPSAVRPPGTMSEPPRSMNGPLGSLGGPFGSMGALGSMGGPLNLIRPPHLPNFLSLPPIETAGIPTSREDSQSSCSSDRLDEREEGRPINFSSSPRSLIEPECELKIDENAPVIKSPLTKDPEDQLESSDEQELKGSGNTSSENGQNDKQGDEPSEGLANLQNMIMKLNNSKSKLQSDSTTICKICNKDMENKYFLHAHMMNEHGMLHVEDDRKGDTPVSLPQYPADLSKMAEKSFGHSQGLTIPNPMLNLSRPQSLVNGFPKLSDKPLNIFEQMQQGLPPRPNFLEQMKKDLGTGAGAGIDIPLSPIKRPSLDRDPNKKPASLSRSYCEICKKELCNKYFMKTHMMKMHGIMMEDGPPKGAVPCDICKKELSSRYFLKVHMAHEHGLNEDGTPIPPHMRESGLLNMFPMGGDFNPPPPLGEFSRLLMQQGEKNMERQKELERQRETNGGGGHVCSLCSNTFPDIIALQVHIIKSHGALPPTAGLDGLFKPNERQNIDEKDEKEKENEKEQIAEEEEKNVEDEGDDGEISSYQGPPPNSMFPFPMGLPGQDLEASKNLQELLQRQLQFPGIMNPLMGFPGLAAGGGAPNQQFQGLFNMFLSEMLKKVQKDTPPQTPPSSPPPVQVNQEEPCVEETST